MRCRVEILLKYGEPQCVLEHGHAGPHRGEDKYWSGRGTERVQVSWRYGIWCPSCGRSFMPKRSNAVYCSLRCRTKKNLSFRDAVFRSGPG